MTRGIVYAAWGDRHLNEAVRSAATARKQGYQTCLLTADSRDWRHAFDLQRQVDFSILGDVEPLAKKWVYLTETPFDTTCFLDTDTYVQGSIDLGFELAEQYGLVATISPGQTFHYGGREFIHYNGGTLYFTGKRPDLQAVFCEADRKLKGSGLKTDEPAMSLAIREHSINPVILPPVFNLIRAGCIHTRQIRVYHSHSDFPVSEVVSDLWGNEFVR